MHVSQFDTNSAPIPWTEGNIIIIIEILHSPQFFLFLSTIRKTFCGALLTIDIQSEPKCQLAIYAILHSNIKAFSSANLLNTVLKILTVKFDALFTY